jgi:hypothetical protein
MDGDLLNLETNTTVVTVWIKCIVALPASFFTTGN